MEAPAQKAWRIVGSILNAAWMLFLGPLVFRAGYFTVGQWRSISPAYAACGLLWILAGLAMFLAGLWLLVSLGRSRIPLAVSGAAAAVAGSVLVLGVLTHVVLCSGPA